MSDYGSDEEEEDAAYYAEEGPHEWHEPDFERRRPRTEDSELLDELYRDIEARTPFNRPRTQHVNALTTMLPVRKERVRRVPRAVAASNFIAVSQQHGAVQRIRSTAPGGPSPPRERVSHPPCGGRLRLARSVAAQPGLHDEPRSPARAQPVLFPALVSAHATSPGPPAAQLAKRDLVFVSPQPDGAPRASLAALSLARERAAARRTVPRTESAPAELCRASPTGTALAAAPFDPRTHGAFAASRAVETGVARRAQLDGGGPSAGLAEGSQGYDAPPRRGAGQFVREQLARRARSHPTSAELPSDSFGDEPSLASHSAPELLELGVSASECAHEIALPNDAPYFPHTVSNPRLRLEQRLASVRARGRRSLDNHRVGRGGPAAASSPSAPAQVVVGRQPFVHARPRRLHALEVGATVGVQ